MEQNIFLCRFLSVALRNIAVSLKKKANLPLFTIYILSQKKRTGGKSSDACLILMESKYVPHPLKTLIKATVLFFNDGPINLPASMKVTVIYLQF